METLGLKKLFDKIGDALNIFDFSFLISGFVSLSIIMAGVTVHVGFSWFDGLMSWPTWLMVIVVLLLVYVCGLVSWMIGKEMRKSCLSDDSKNESPEQKDFTLVYDGLVRSLGLQDSVLPQFTNKMDIYYYMWIKLDSIKESENENVKGRLAYCNRLWVMRALFEGLMTSCLLGFLLLIDLIFIVKVHRMPEIMVCGVGFFVLITLMYFAYKTANSYAHSQIKEIVIAYKVYVLEASK